MAEKTAMEPGFYVGVFRNTRSFMMSEPKIMNPANTVSSFEELFESYQRKANPGKAVKANASSVKPSQTGITTSCSGWVRATLDPKQFKWKAVLLPDLYKEAGGSDPALAEEQVKKFKQGAARLLAENVGKEDEAVLSVIRQINANACTVQEIRVKLLQVSLKEFPGCRKVGDRFFGEVLLRRFYVKDVPTDDLLKEMAKIIVSPDLTVNAKNRVVISKRNDWTPDNRYTGDRFSIVSSSVAEKDFADHIKIIEYLNAKVAKLRS